MAELPGFWQASCFIKAVLIISGAFVIASVTLFLISFISFALKSNGVLVLPIFGLIIVAIILIAILEALFKHFSFTYRRPVLYSIIGILIVVLLSALIIDRTPFHRGLFNRAREGRLPIFGPAYRRFGPRDITPFHRDLIR